MYASVSEEMEEIYTKYNNMVCPMGIGGQEISLKGHIIGKACIGPRCMAWGWVQLPIYDKNEEITDYYDSEEVGFCGFVGE